MFTLQSNLNSILKENITYKYYPYLLVFKNFHNSNIVGKILLAFRYHLQRSGCKIAYFIQTFST